MADEEYQQGEDDEEEESDYDYSFEENETEDEGEQFFTEEGLPKLDDRFYSGFLERLLEKDADRWLTEWVERIKNTNENKVILRHAVFVAGKFPEEYRDRIIFSMLSQYEMLRQRATEINEILGDDESEDEYEKYIVLGPN